MKLWDKGNSTNQRIEEFTVGRDREFDTLLAKHDILGSVAHAQMLAAVGILRVEEAEQLCTELRKLYAQVERGDFTIAEDAEDVHSHVELLLTQSLGEIGKKIHTGRSRNDQVLLDIKLFIRDELLQISSEVQQLFDTLLHSAERYQEYLLPGYTHFQVAMPSSFGLWFSAYAESLVDDMEALLAAFNVANKNPLGSAAGYGSSFPLNRSHTTQLLGFSAMNVSSVYAQMTRGKTEKAAATAVAAIGSTLARLAYDICLYSSQNFGFVQLPAEYTTGSSIMPHKQNPDVFELIRAKCNRLQAVPTDIAFVSTNLPSGYHRDFQILKELLFPALRELRQCIAMSNAVVPQLIIAHDIMKDERYLYAFSVDAVNELVQQGISFRDAYKQVGLSIQRGEFNKPAALQHTHEGSIGNLGLDLIRQQMEKLQQRIDSHAIRKAEQALTAPAF